MSERKLSFETLQVHAGQEVDPTTGLFSSFPICTYCRILISIRKTSFNFCRSIKNSGTQIYNSFYYGFYSYNVLMDKA